MNYEDFTPELQSKINILQKFLKEKCSCKIVNKYDNFIVMKGQKQDVFFLEENLRIFCTGFLMSIGVNVDHVYDIWKFVHSKKFWLKK